MAVLVAGVLALAALFGWTWWRQARRPAIILTRDDVQRILEDTIANLTPDADFGPEWREFLDADFDDGDLALAQHRCAQFEIPTFPEDIPGLQEEINEVLARLRRATPHVVASTRRQRNLD